MMNKKKFSTIFLEKLKTKSFWCSILFTAIFGFLLRLSLKMIFNLDTKDSLEFFNLLYNGELSVFSIDTFSNPHMIALYIFSLGVTLAKVSSQLFFEYLFQYNPYIFTTTYPPTNNTILLMSSPPRNPAPARVVFPTSPEQIQDGGVFDRVEDFTLNRAGIYLIDFFGTVVIQQYGPNRIRLTMIIPTDVEGRLDRGWINNPHNPSTSNQPTAGNIASLLECLRANDFVHLNRDVLLSDPRLTRFLTSAYPNLGNALDKRITQALINNLRYSR